MRPLLFRVCICLPQYSWNSASDEIQVLCSPAKVLYFTGSSRKYPNDTAPHNPENQTNDFKKETDGYDTDNVGKPNDNDLAQTRNRSANPAFASPSTSKSLNKTPSTVKTGYYGPLTSLDSQEELNDIIGIQPRMYHAFEQDKKSHYARRELERFVDACQLDFFIPVCLIDYVGTDTNENMFNVQEVCNEIYQLR